MVNSKWTGLTALFTAVTLCGLVAEATAQNQSATEAKSFQITRTTTAPVVDGELDDAVWQQAPIIDDFHQIEPGDGAEPSEYTEVQMAYDDDFLYIAGTLYEEDPSQITANIMQHGSTLANDDRLAIIIDPFNAGRNAYRFETNANGIRHEMLYIGPSTLSADWEVIWDVASRVHNEGWSFEMAIPFKSLPFDQNIEDWGINFSRGIRRHSEETAWVSRNRSYGPSIVGQVTGLQGMEQGLGLDVVPSVSVGQSRTYSPGDTETIFEPSLDAFYRVTPSLNASLTINTDFSATEVDDRQVDLTRFGLFFPEKRTFFLNDADLFDFGRISTSDNQAHGGATRENGRPFFSRRIGLGADGSPVDIQVGGKLSGRVGPWSIGTLAVRQAEDGNIDASTLLVSRIQRDVLAESSVGVIFTSGDPTSNVDNTLFGADFLYQNTNLPGNRTLRAQGWIQKTDTDGLSGDDMSWGAGISLPSNEGLRGELQVKEVQQNFNPALGFVNRADIRDYDVTVAYNHYFETGILSELFESVYSGVDYEQVRRIDGDLQSGTIKVRALEFDTNTNDEIELTWQRNQENVFTPFEIYEDNDSSIIIEPDDYTFDEYSISFITGAHRDLSGSLEYVGGEFYNGDRMNVIGALTWNPSPKLSARLEYDWNRISLPQGDFKTQLMVADVAYTFFLGLTWKNLIQYDTVSEVMGLNSRLTWNVHAGQEAFVVLNHNWEDFDRDNKFENASTDLIFKFGYTFRF